MTFSSMPEIQTFKALASKLGPLGYSISQKVRVIDALRAASANPEAMPAGPTLLDESVRLFRAAAGLLREDHPWLEPGDWRYAFRSHFDFVVHARQSEERPLDPLFAVEFDGASHTDQATRARDCAKNRLCAAAGLPLVRIDYTFLYHREQLTLVEWLAELWAAYREDMPRMIADRDAAINAMTREELDEAGPWLMGERPDLDVILIFKLEHPFPPACSIARRLADRYGFRAPLVHGVRVETPRWRVVSWQQPLPSLITKGLVETWTMKLTVEDPTGRQKELTGMAQVAGGYPLKDGPLPDWTWRSLVEDLRLPYLPAGPWGTAPLILGEALCLHNTLVEAERWMSRHDPRPRQPS